LQNVFGDGAAADAPLQERQEIVAIFDQPLHHHGFGAHGFSFDPPRAVRKPCPPAAELGVAMP
jgi:hypothetical protein